jgi:hypothetical protein
MDNNCPDVSAPIPVSRPVSAERSKEWGAMLAEQAPMGVYAPRGWQ